MLDYMDEQGRKLVEFLAKDILFDEDEKFWKNELIAISELVTQTKQGNKFYSVHKGSDGIYLKFKKPDHLYESVYLCAFPDIPGAKMRLPYTIEAGFSKFNGDLFWDISFKKYTRLEDLIEDTQTKSALAWFVHALLLAENERDIAVNLNKVSNLFKSVLPAYSLESAVLADNQIYLEVKRKDISELIYVKDLLPTDYESGQFAKRSRVMMF